ncbi:MAG: sugar phosphate isomerase/epimerase family protein [Chloroflexota bacterium]|nr:sugar phosphate isomerase/epimerase family protein [Chloroflexota bacterium]
MKISCAAYSFRQYLQDGEMSLEDFIRKGYEMGLDGVELTSYYFPTTEVGYLKQLKRLALSYGLDISGTAIGGSFALPDQERAEQVALAREWVDISVTLGAPCLRVFGGRVPEGHTEEEASSWCIEGLKEAAEYAEEKGVVLALENHGGITSTSERVKHIVEEVGSDWLQVNLDLGNYRADPYREIAETLPYAVTSHAKTQGRDPSGQRFLLDYPRILRILREKGYKGYLSIEYEAEEEPLLAVPRFAGYLKSLVAW